ncbi:MAG TPA: D-alanine--D-alanine ligase A [Ruminococcus sp.]|nr:D-alanine--D-alanine ligase A [Ruminococcus sp.]
MAKIKAAVIFGGVSREHELSCASAADVIRNIPTDKYEVMCIGITKKGRWLYFPGSPDEISDGTWDQNSDCTPAIISPDPINCGIIVIEDGEATVRRLDVVFPVLQGKFGADGAIQGLLDMAGIPYVGSGLLASASCTDKSHTHMVLDDYKIKTADWRLIAQRDINNIEELCHSFERKMGFPLLVKPAKSGSTAGTGVARSYDELLSAVKVAFSNDNKVLVEKHLTGRKLETAVFGYESPKCTYVGEILSTGAEYDPTEVRRTSGDDLRIPAEIPGEVQDEIRHIAIEAYKALGCRGMARIDFILTSEGEIVLNKIGTAPGLRTNSVLPKLMTHYGTTLPELVDMLLEQAIDNAVKKY